MGRVPRLPEDPREPERREGRLGLDDDGDEEPDGQGAEQHGHHGQHAPVAAVGQRRAAGPASTGTVSGAPRWSSPTDLTTGSARRPDRPGHLVSSVWPLGPVTVSSCGPVLVLHRRRKGHVVQSGGQVLAAAGVGGPVEDLDHLGTGGGAGLLLEQDGPAVTRDRVAGGAGLVDDGEVGGRHTGLLVGVGGHGRRAGHHVAAGRVLDRGVGHLVLDGVRQLDVADGVRGRQDRGGHTRVLRGLRGGGRPGDGLRGAERPRRRVRRLQVVGEDVRGARAVGPDLGGDGVGRQGDPGVEGGDLRGVPRRDGAVEDAGQRGAVELDPVETPGRL